MKLIISHPTGNAFVRSAAIAFQRANMLHEFYTSLATFSGSMLDRLSIFGPFSEISRRRYDQALKPFTKMWPWLEIGRQIASKGKFEKLTRHETGALSVDAVYKNFDKYVASRLKEISLMGVHGVYAYEDGALHSFREAKKLGLQCLYDLPIGYWRSARKLLSIEQERWPDWAPTLIGLRDSEAKLAFKDEELLMADRIFVASSFTAKTLQEYPGVLAPIEVIPYAFPHVSTNRTYSTNIKHRRLKLLFVGGLSQRKGIADLFAAIEPLKEHVELTVVGLKASENCPALDAALARHNWIPTLPHSEVLKLMQQHDVLVFPSLFEGFGLVITEAMSQGTPVITTNRTAGPDIITHGENGWLIDAGSTLALQEAIEDILYKPMSVAEVGKSAMETARDRSWKSYENDMINAVEKHFSSVGFAV